MLEASAALRPATANGALCEKLATWATPGTVGWSCEPCSHRTSVMLLVQTRQTEGCCKQFLKASCRLIVNAGARPPRPTDLQGGWIKGEIQAEMAQPQSKRSKPFVSSVSLLSVHDGYSRVLPSWTFVMPCHQLTGKQQGLQDCPVFAKFLPRRRFQKDFFFSSAGVSNDARIASKFR